MTELSILQQEFEISIVPRHRFSKSHFSPTLTEADHPPWLTGTALGGGHGVEMFGRIMILLRDKTTSL